METLKSFFWVVKIQWRTSHFYIFWKFFESIIFGLMPLANAYVASKLLAGISSAALNGGDVKNVYFYFALTLIINISWLIFTSTGQYISNIFHKKIELAISEVFLSKMYELSQEQFDDEQFNTKVERAKDAMYQLWRVMSDIFDSISVFISFIGALTAILIVSPVIGIISAVAISILAIVRIKINKQREALYVETETQDRVANRTRWMLLDAKHMPEIRLMYAFKKLIKIWRTSVNNLNAIWRKKDKKIAVVDVLTESIQPIVSVGSTIYFFNLLIKGALGLDRFVFLRTMLEQTSSGIIRVSNSIQALHELSIRLRNFSEINNTPPAIPNGKISVEKPMTIEFKNVSFSYPNSSAKALKNVSFVMNHGTKLAVVGENGAGKSTIIKLLLRQYLPNEGSILINGVDIKDIEEKSYYSLISNLSQEFVLFEHLTIKENFTIGKDGAISDDEIYKVTDLVDMTEFINTLPSKLDTRLDTSFKSGTKLSGGQKQRIAVSRALLRDGDLMLLDEPTSAVDARAERTIFNNIYKYHESGTTLIVSHRFSTVRRADSIIVMNKGELIEYGTHEELIKYGGLYKDMFEAQAEGYR